MCTDGWVGGGHQLGLELFVVTKQTSRKRHSFGRQRLGARFQLRIRRSRRILSSGCAMHARKASVRTLRRAQGLAASEKWDRFTLFKPSLGIWLWV